MYRGRTVEAQRAESIEGVKLRCSYRGGGNDQMVLRDWVGGDARPT
jgi:hypothetical protein